jgi:hypothetical protein
LVIGVEDGDEHERGQQTEPTPQQKMSDSLLHSVRSSSPFDARRRNWLPGAFKETL